MFAKCFCPIFLLVIGYGVAMPEPEPARGGFSYNPIFTSPKSGKTKHNKAPISPKYDSVIVGMDNLDVEIQNFALKTRVHIKIFGRSPFILNPQEMLSLMYIWRSIESEFGKAFHYPYPLNSVEEDSNEKDLWPLTPEAGHSSEEEVSADPQIIVP